MRRLFVVCLLIAFCVPVFASNDFGVSLSLDVANNADLGGGISGDLNTGFTLGMSYLFLKTHDEIFKCGPGISYWLPRYEKGYSVISYSDFAGYLIAQVYPLRSSGFGFYLKGNLGYNAPIISDLDLIDSNLSTGGGFYFGVGAGMDFDNGMFVEFVYNNYSWKLRYLYYSSGCKYENLAITLGFRFL